MTPLKDYCITYPYGTKNSRYSKGYHTGIDLAAADYTVRATAPGIIQEARYAPGRGADPNGWGNYVILRSQGYDIIHAHLSNVAVAKGQAVSEGAVLGRMGSTGQSTGPHLHFEVRKVPWTARNDVDPKVILEKGDKEMAEKSLKEELASDDTYLTVRVRESKVEEAIKEINKLGYAAKRLDLA